MKDYRFLRAGKSFTIPVSSAPMPVLHTKPLYAGDYGFYRSEQVKEVGNGMILTSERMTTPLYHQPTIDEQIRCKVPTHPYSHFTAALTSNRVWEPPFHLQVICDVFYDCNYLPCPAWMCNDTQIFPTREPDMVEFGKMNKFPYLNQLWFADNIGDVAYTNRKLNTTSLILPPKPSKHQFDMYVWRDRIIRYMDGYQVMDTEGDWFYKYWLHVSLIVLNPKAENKQWTIYKLSIEDI
jgi:hypothetical protein